jgi:hypothetical protein
MTQDKKIAAFCRERDEMLLAADVDRSIAFGLKHNPHALPPSSREVAEISMHKAITAVRTLPLEHRRKSYRWLTERGYTSHDDGELKDS